MHDVIIFHLTLSRMDSITFDDVMQMPCLGRNLKLGDLYDCCNDKIVISNSIWDEKTIHEAQLEGKSEKDPIEYTRWVINNIDKKASCLGINGELYLSCVSNSDNVKLEDEAKFFHDSSSSKSRVCVALKCYSLSKVIQVNKKKILNSVSIETFELETATHVVTSIGYGAISIIVCEQEIQEKHDIQTIHENLKTKINYLQSRIRGNCPEKLGNMESTSENITCKVFSTLQYAYNIKTYTDAIKFSEELFKLHTDYSTHKPITVSLYPLKKINKSFTKCAKNIDIDMIDHIKAMYDAMINMDMDIKDLQANIGTTLPYITEQIESYYKLYDDLYTDFTKTLRCIVPKYRKGNINESDLKKRINTLYDRLKKLYYLVQSKLKEVQHIGIFLKALKDYEIISSNCDVLFSYKYVICLAFNTRHLIHHELPKNTSPWYQDKKLIAEMRYKIKQFLKFAKENSINKDIKFAISEFSDDEYSELVGVLLYYDKETLLLEPPTPPSRPLEYITQKTDSSITIAWSEPQQSAAFFSSYCIHFRQADNDKWIASSTVKCPSNTATIEQLEANTGYLFKVTATMKIGIPIESQVSEVIFTAAQCEAKTVRKTVSSESTKYNASSDSQVTPLKSKSNTTLTCRNDSTAISYQKQEAGNEIILHDQVTEDDIKKGNEIATLNVPATQTPTENTEPKISIIQDLYYAKKCEKLNDGSPSIYKLNTTYVHMKHIDVESFNFQIGKRNEQLSEKVILLVGATGAGKTTLVNGLINCIFGIKWENPGRLVVTETPTNNKKGISQGHSQTTHVTVYKINHSKYDQFLYNLTIIDTPGFEDTDGLNKDNTIMAKIKGLLTSDQVIDHIDGIGFVVQAPLSRLSPTQSYVIKSVYSLFGNDVANNIFVLATFSDEVSDPHVLSALGEAKIKYNKMFKFNNSALYANTNRKKNDKCLLNKLLWEMGMESFNIFFRDLEVIIPVSLSLTKDVLNERKKLQILLEGLQTQMNDEFMNMQVLKHKEKMLIKHKREAQKNEKFQYQVNIVQKEWVRQSRLGTTCRRCQLTCHKNCVESEYGEQCIMMKLPFLYGSYTCELCKCSINEHFTSNYAYVTFIRTETITYGEMKQRYDKAHDAQINIEKIIQEITSKLQRSQEKAQVKLFDIHKCIHRINEISLQPNINSEMDYILGLIRSEKAEQTEGYTTRIEFYQNILKDIESRV